MIGTADAAPPSGPARLQHCSITEQTDLEIHGAINDGIVCREPTVGDAQDELGPHDSFHVDAVNHLLDGWKHLAGELELAQAEGATLARGAQPAQEKSKQLP